MWAFVILAPYRGSYDTLALLKEIKLLNEGLTEPCGAVHWKTMGLPAAAAHRFSRTHQTLSKV